MSQSIPAPLKPNDFEAVTMDGNAHGITPAKVAKCHAALIQFQGADGYYRMDGTDPVASAGGGLYTTDGATPMFLERIDLTNFKGIAASGKMVIHYLA